MRPDRVLYLILLLLVVQPGTGFAAQPSDKEQAEKRSLKLKALNDHAIQLKSQGDIPNALIVYRQALELARELGEVDTQAQILSNEGELFVALNQPDTALDYFRQALKLLGRKGHPKQRFYVFSGVGAALHDLGFPHRARWAYDLALAQKCAATDDCNRDFVQSRLCITLRDEGRMGEAEGCLQEVNKHARKVGNSLREAYTFADLAHLYDMQGRGEKAVATFDQALGLLEKTNHAVRAKALFGRAESEAHLGHLDKALDSVEQSIGIVEPLRSILVDPGMRVAFFASRHNAYELKVDLLMAKGLAEQAFEVGEISRSRTLLDDLEGKPVEAPWSLAAIQHQVLDKDTLLLSYALGDKRSFLWAVTPDSFKFFALKGRAEIEEMVRKVSEGKGNRASDVRILSGMLFPAGLGPLGKKLLLIVPDGALHQVPFAALYDRRLPGHPLIFDHTLALVPSASVIGGMRRKYERRQPLADLLAILADPVFDRDDVRFKDDKAAIGKDLPGGLLPRLGYTGKEAKAILRLVPPGTAATAFDFDATRDRFLSPGFLRHRFLHVATHYLDQGHPDFSGLVLSRLDRTGNPRDGFLSIRQIYGLQLPVELVVLSACGTGLGRQVRGEGPIGMTRAFLHAGARRVVVSLWDVGERATSELMSRFYRSMIVDRLPPAAALQAAQASMARDPDRRLRAPQAWAGFVLQGEPR